jgi:PTH1 family peptidyl-tRNA hydrolase
VGIGRPPGQQDPADYVLSPFAKSEREVLPNLIADAADATEQVLADGLVAAQQRWHTQSGDKG